ncbi:hypothetical protein [Acinetobacter beijerinckii]|uniref:hypothetical protein n=1 Tax=Acinetobacter beijerinckii TaxID=262668 RepID=UPI0030193A85
MIFAFVISFLAQEIAEFLIVFTNNWQLYSASGKHESSVQLIPAILHMSLALLMISISWVSWSKSKAAGNQQDIQNIFSVKFITFILEVLLVTLYYSLAKSVEVDFSEYTKNKTITSYVTAISAKPEALQMLLIFTMFAIWDFIVDIMISPRNPALTNKFKIFLSWLPGTLVYCSISIICALATGFLLWILPKEESILIVAASDIALIALLFLFYKAKKLEYYFRLWFPAEATRNNTIRDVPPTKGDWYLILFIAIIYSMSIITIKLAPCIQKSLG